MKMTFDNTYDPCFVKETFIKNRGFYGIRIFKFCEKISSFATESGKDRFVFNKNLWNMSINERQSIQIFFNEKRIQVFGKREMKNENAFDK